MSTSPATSSASASAATSALPPLSFSPGLRAGRAPRSAPQRARRRNRRRALHLRRARCPQGRASRARSPCRRRPSAALPPCPRPSAAGALPHLEPAHQLLPEIAAHPLRRYFDAGALVTLNTDDPEMFQTTLVREYQLAQDAFGFTNEELRQLAANSFRASWLPEERKHELLNLL